MVAIFIEGLEYNGPFMDTDKGITTSSVVQPNLVEDDPDRSDACQVDKSIVGLFVTRGVRNSF